MSVAPSTAPTGRILPYDVGFPVITNPFSSFFQDLIVESTIGAQADGAAVRLYTKGCVNETELDSLTAAVSIAANSFNADLFSYNISFSPGNFVSDSVGFVTYDPTFGFSVGSVELCTRVSSYFGPIAVSFLEANFRFSFDLTANGFAIEDIELQELDPQEIEDDVGTLVNINACQVNSMRDCESYTITQNFPLRMVLYLTPEIENLDIMDVSIFNLNMTVYSDNIEYVPIEVGETSWETNQITQVVPFVDERGNCLLIETFIIAEFFFQDVSELAVEGFAFITFVDERTTINDVEPYDLIIDIGKVTRLGCFQYLLSSIENLF